MEQIGPSVLKNQPQTATIHRIGRDSGWLQFGTTHTSLLVPFSGSKGPVVHVHGLTGSRKALCESRLGYLHPCAWCAWTVRECSFNVKP